MERIVSVFQIIASAFILLFAVGTTIRCIVNGNDFFYTVMFSMMALAGRVMLRFAVEEYKESRHGDNE